MYLVSPDLFHLNTLETVRHSAHFGERHAYTSVLDALPVAVPGLPRNGRVEAATLWVSPRVLSGRLASRAALICSGVLTSGSESLILLFARATCRL